MQERTNGDLLNILSEGRNLWHPALCPAAWELVNRVREDDHDAKEGLVALAGNGRLVAQVALEELGVRYVPETVLQKARESVEQRRGWQKAMARWAGKEALVKAPPSWCARPGPTPEICRQSSRRPQARHPGPRILYESEFSSEESAQPRARTMVE